MRGSARGRRPVISTFADLGVAPDITEALGAAGITEPFPIQSLAIPLALRGDDLIGQARTGTGKTIAFSVPVLQRIGTAADADRRPRALVVTPTRELALQVAEDVELAGSRRATAVATVYGGRAYEPQIEALRNGVDVVVGTPGRLLDLAGQRALDLSAVQVLVLDEADRMLDLGFVPDVERIVALVPRVRQTMLFSATMPGPVVTLARRYLTRPTHIRAESAEAQQTVPTTRQFVYLAHRLDKPEVLARVMQARERGLAMVYCQTKRACDRVAEDLTGRGFAAAAVHGDLGQGARERALRAFRSGKIDILVATDVAARGIDVPGVTHVVNYECPADEHAYVHRIGRTGRAGHTGTAVTLVDAEDTYRWKMINDALDLSVPEPVETYSTSAHLYADLDVPEGAKGTLPRAARTRAGLEAEQVEDVGETGRPKRTAAKPAGRRPGARTKDGGADGERESRPRRSRTRQRTRGGNPVPEQATAAPSRGEDEAAQPSPATAGAAPRRRRRRSRGGASGSTGQAGGDTAALEAESA